MAGMTICDADLKHRRKKITKNYQKRKRWKNELFLCRIDNAVRVLDDWADHRVYQRGLLSLLVGWPDALDSIRSTSTDNQDEKVHHSAELL